MAQKNRCLYPNTLSTTPSTLGDGIVLNTILFALFAT